MGRIEVKELLDEPQPIKDVEASLRDVRQVNRFLSGISVTQGHLKKLMRRHPRGSAFTLLDLATGSGDIPRASVKWARRSGYTLSCTCLDVNPAILEVARKQNAEYPEMAFMQGDARHVPFEDARFDYVTCSLALHHFGPEDAVTILHEMNRLSRRGLILNDLRRSRVAWVLIWLLTRLLRANRLTKHDGPVSTLRAYTPSELRTLAERAGLTGYKIKRHAFYRMALVVDKEKSPVERPRS